MMDNRPQQPFRSQTPSTPAPQAARIAVVIPSYRVTAQILDVLARIGPEVAAIYVVDDRCPDRSGDFVQAHCADARVRVIRRKDNGGVGLATITGYRQAMADGCDILVKIDGDGQMDPRLLPRFVRPILDGTADYAKGNRFFNPEDVRSMPAVRLAGNAVLSFMTKLSSGYWNIFDPTNGYTAVHARTLAQVPLERIAPRYFFESDLLFRLGTIRAAVIDIPMTAVYGEERSHLRVFRVIPAFFAGHARNLAKRIVYNYFLRDFSIATLELTFGALILVFGVIFGAWNWAINASRGVITSSGTVMLSALPIIAGLQMILSFINYDILSVPRRALHPFLSAGEDEGDR
jgi:glycosyltransferase involved in cell wall biosynthesis